MIKILIADDHDLVLEGYKSILNSIDHIEVVSTASNGLEVLRNVQAKPADIVLLDINMPKLNGTETLIRIKKEFPNVKTIVLTMYDDAIHIKQMVDLGAEGYLLKNSDKSTLIRAIETVHEGKHFYDGEVTKTILNKFKQTIELDNEEVTLSERELEIITLIVSGASSSDIAEKLFISPHTVKTHRKNINFKLNIHSPAELILFAKKHNLMA